MQYVPGICLPRGIPAASLKPVQYRRGRQHGLRRLPRGIPAASLKRNASACRDFPITSSAGNTRGLIEASGSAPSRSALPMSSAGNTRGLIEAPLSQASYFLAAFGSLPRGIPAASLKRDHVLRVQVGGECLPRGIPAASLKRVRAVDDGLACPSLPRGIPAASLKRAAENSARISSSVSSAGNTRGLIEASHARDRRSPR